MNSSRIERALRAATVVFFIILILIIMSGQIVKGSGPAEWLSALLNLVMAGAAVMAFLTARSWLPQLTTQEGYRLAINLVNNEFIWLGSINPLHIAVSNLCAAAEDYFKEGSTRREEIMLGTTIRDLKPTLDQSKTRIEVIKITMFQMQTYGLQVANTKQASMTAMLLYHKECFDIASRLMDIVSDYHTDRVKRMREDRSFDPKIASSFKYRLATDDSETLTEVRNLSSKIGTAWQNMVDSQRMFTGSDHRIGKLFLLRKD